MPGSSSKFLIATSVATSVALVSWYFMVYRKRGIVRRAAFDIGSGASKVLVADVDVSQGVVVGRPIYEIELPLAFKADAQQSKDGSLSDAITEKGLELIASLTETARKAGATEAHGVATEVFRSAPNGLAFLTAIQQRTGVAISILSQDREAVSSILRLCCHAAAAAAAAAALTPPCHSTLASRPRTAPRPRDRRGPARGA